MAQPTTTSYSISDFLEWNVSKQLVIAPKFQRRDVWIQKAKSYLIDTILRELPIPPLFIRLKIDTISKRVVREVVDGQQRLRTVLSFIAGDFPILQAHNPELAGMYYTDLSEKLQHQFLRYHFLVNTLTDVTDQEVLGIFARLNTYTVKLNAQELRNSAYFGLFKQMVYKLAHQYYSFWRSNNILTDQTIARMGDAELVSELVVSMMDGIRQTKANDLEGFYKKYDDVFPRRNKIVSEFDATMDLVGYIFGDDLGLSPFRRIPLFYTVFCAVYDRKFGLPHSRRSQVSFSAKQVLRIRAKFDRLGKILVTDNPPKKYLQFIEDSRLSTADVGRRKRRHKFTWDNVLTSD